MFDDPHANSLQDEIFGRGVPDPDALPLTTPVDILTAIASGEIWAMELTFAQQDAVSRAIEHVCSLLDDAGINPNLKSSDAAEADHV